MSPRARRTGVAAIIVAAGSGERYGQQKHALELEGKPLWQWSVEAFRASDLSEIIVVGDVPGGVQGGVRRRDSVSNGLGSLASNPEWVLIHDAARPLVSVDLINRVVDGFLTEDVDGVVPGTPVTDTLKRVDGGFIHETVDRSSLVAVQTPQAFRKDVLIRAHTVNTDSDATDDATLVERLGSTVRLVRGEGTNIKITYPGDLALAEFLLKERAS